MTNCTCDHRPWSYTDPEPTPDQDCPAHGDPAILRTRAEVLSTATADDAHRAAATINDGLDNLFRKLGPPTDRSTEQ